MLPDIANRQSVKLTLFKEDFYRKLIDDYTIRVKPGLQHYGTRYVYYHEADNTLLVSHSWGSRVHLINLNTGNLRYHDFHSKTVRKILVYNNEIITASWDGTIRVVDYHTLKERLMLGDPEMGRSPCVSVSPSGEHLVSFSYDSDIKPEYTSNRVRLWQLNNGHLKRIFHNTGEHMSYRRSGYCLIHENNLYVISNSGYLNVYQLGTGMLVSSIFLSLNLRAMCLHPSRNLIFIGNEAGEIHVCRLIPTLSLYTIKAHRYDISEFRVHPEREDILITIAFDGKVKFWKLPSFSCECEISCDYSMLWTQTMKKDIFFTGSDEGEIWIFDVHDLPNVRLKGKMKVYNDFFVVYANDSRFFYTNDISKLELLNKDNNEPVNGKQAEYLLNSFNKEWVLHDVFRSDIELKAERPCLEKLMPQLPPSFL